MIGLEIRGKRFNSLDEAVTTVQEVIDSISALTWRNTFLNCFVRMRKCMETMFPCNFLLNLAYIFYVFGVNIWCLKEGMNLLNDLYKRLYQVSFRTSITISKRMTK